MKSSHERLIGLPADQDTSSEAPSSGFAAVARSRPPTRRGERNVAR
jgi:hypothetical protein